MANDAVNADSVKKEYKSDYHSEEEQGSGFDLRIIWGLILRYKYFLAISIAVCLGLAYLYLHYNTVDVYSTFAKMLIKDPERKTYYASNSIISTLSDMGRRNFSNGFDNEIEVLKTKTINSKVVRDMKFYTSYIVEGKIKDVEIYAKDAPYNVDYDNSRLDSLKYTINVDMTNKGNGIHAYISYVTSSSRPRQKRNTNLWERSSGMN